MIGRMVSAEIEIQSISRNLLQRCYKIINFNLPHSFITTSMSDRPFVIQSLHLSKVVVNNDFIFGRQHDSNGLTHMIIEFDRHIFPGTLNPE